MEKTRILENYQAVRKRIAFAAEAAGRDSAAIKIVVVTKGHPLEVVQEAFVAGARLFGENYVEEGVAKIESLKLSGVEWHMIGHVQSRKARQVCQYFDTLHSLDSEKLARRLDSFSAEIDRKPTAFLECNVSGEVSKFGLPAWDEQGWESLIPLIRSITGYSNLHVQGLMTMAPYSSNPEDSRPFFHRLRKFSQFLEHSISDARFDDLSMGMSGDFEAAIAEGATIVRIGTAIFGSRPTY
ncbi:MAG: YggS family pyridoxal phosphate enzyme [Chloroflexi bacterium RBG_16_54_18]|nr:MAG: YggS family pyridoxal phosphate enzyme [Chloroflexi bacterium RBG_16_54_18]